MSEDKDNPELKRLRYQAQIKQQNQELKQENQALRRENALLRELNFSLEQQKEDLINRLAKRTVENKQLQEQGISYSSDSFIVPLVIIAILLFAFYSLSALHPLIFPVILILFFLIGSYFYNKKIK